MSEAYEYRTVRVARAGWREVADAIHADAGEAARAVGGSVFALFSGLIGFATDEGVVLSAWPDVDTLTAHAARTVGAVAGIVESSAERLAPTVRPIDATPLVPGAPADVYAHRWFWLQPQDWPEFLALSQDGVWPYFEADGCRIIGLWRSIEPGPLARALLITRYPSIAHWERTRLQSPDPPPGAGERLYRGAQAAGRRRAELTERSIVRLSRLA